MSSPATAAPRARQVDAPPADEPALDSLISAAMDAVRGAALACRGYIGRGDPVAADGAATCAIRQVLDCAPGTGTIVCGEGAKDGAPMLCPGESVGRGGLPVFDVAVDPLEGTTACAAGLPGSIATIAFGGDGALAVLPSCSWYAEKLLVGAGARGAIDIECPPSENAVNVAARLGKPVDELEIVVLQKPRHRDLIETLRRLGARVSTPLDGDLPAALRILLGEGPDLLMGVGGSPEAVLTACAAAALGGELQVRLAPQRDEETRALLALDIDLARVYSGDEVAVGETIFAACGVTGGELLRAPESAVFGVRTESLLVTTGAGRRVVEVAAAPEDSVATSADASVSAAAPLAT